MSRLSSNGRIRSERGSKEAPANSSDNSAPPPKLPTSSCTASAIRGIGAKTIAAFRALSQRKKSPKAKNTSTPIRKTPSPNDRYIRKGSFGEKLKTVKNNKNALTMHRTARRPKIKSTISLFKDRTKQIGSIRRPNKVFLETSASRKTEKGK